MKLYTVVKTKLTYEQAKEQLEKHGRCITRPDWDGYHTRFFSHYVIITKDLKLIVDPKEIYDIDKNDWMIVIPTEYGFRESYRLLNKFYNKKYLTKGPITSKFIDKLKRK